MGTDLGELARQRFPGGRLVTAGYRQSQEALAQTAELLQDSTVSAIFEGAFQFNQVLVRVDVLERVGMNDLGQPTWRLVEVKSSTKVKATHVDDLTIQSYVLEGTRTCAGGYLSHACEYAVRIRRAASRSRSAVRYPFIDRDRAATIAGSQCATRGYADHAGSHVGPGITPDEHCQSPYECPFWNHCTEHKPARWIYHLPGGSSKTVVHLRVRRGDDRRDSRSCCTHPVQRRVKENREWIGEGLRSALETVVHPVHHLDFETFMPAVPKFLDTRPYQVIPTQWSNHIEQHDGTLMHAEFLCRDERDPREELAITLLESLGQTGGICVYSSYERSVIERLAEDFPSLRKDLKRVVARLWDLHVIIRDHYYHPAFEVVTRSKPSCRPWCRR